MSQRAPGPSNTYVPSWEASMGLLAFTRDAANFRVNQYMSNVTVKKDQGYYLKLDADEPARIVDLDDYLWAEPADAPQGKGETQLFEYTPYRTKRVAFPFLIGYKAAEQADWPVVQAHAMKTVAKSMTLRSMRAAALLNTSGNWGSNTGAQAGAWSTSSTSNNYIQTTINTAMIAIEKATNGILGREDEFKIVFNPVCARAIAKSPEYKTYLQGSPDALAAITSWQNPNRKYGLAPYLYGLEVVVENAVKVTTRKGITTSRSYVWQDDQAVILRKSAAVGEGAEFSDFSTASFRFYEEQTVETKDDPDNRRHAGRVVEDYIETLQAPESGYLITGIS